MGNFADGTGQNAEFKSPNKLLVSGTDIYVRDDQRIRKVDSNTGEVSTFQTSADIEDMYPWTTLGTDIYYYNEEYSNSAYIRKIFKISPDGSPATITK